MSIVVYPDVIVPRNIILAGLTGNLSRKNDRSANQGGYATVNAVRDVSLRQYTLGVKAMKLAQWQQLIAIYEVTDAGAFGMLIEDPADMRASVTEGMVHEDDGVYRLWKRYTAPGGTRARDRMITRPRLEGLSLYRDGVLMASGYTVSTETGIVTIAAPGDDTFTWAGTFYVPVQFADDEIEWDLVRPGGEMDRLIMGPNVRLVEVREA